MLKIFELIGRYFMLMGKVFSRPEKAAIYRRRIIFEMESLGVNSIGLTAIISVFIGAVITLQMCINLDSPFIPRSLVGYATRETMILEFSSAVVALILAGKVGSSIASEIGTMRITEQIDALEIMGVNSASYLILPKIVAAMVFFPFLTILSILIGILAGYVAAFVMGLVLPTTGVTADGVEFTKAWVLNWNKVAQASWFAIPKLMPVKIVFDMRAIMPVMIMFVVTAVETVGDISGVMEGGMNREPTDKELSGGVICDGLGSSFAALFGVLPNTSFSQNVGLVAMTKVVNRMALASGAIFLILCGLIPKLGALISIMPQAVLGGAAVMMFSSIVVSGIQLITKEKMTPRQLTIVSVALGVGYGMGANSGILAQAPHAFQLICGESGIVPAAFVAILLNVLLPKDDKAV